MRTGLAVSVVGHLVILAWGVFTLASPTPLETVIEAVPVDLIPVGDITKLDKGKETAELIAKPSPNDPNDKPAEEPKPAPPPPKPEPKPEPPPPPATPTATAAAGRRARTAAKARAAQPPAPEPPPPPPDAAPPEPPPPETPPPPEPAPTPEPAKPPAAGQDRGGRAAVAAYPAAAAADAADRAEEEFRRQDHGASHQERRAAARRGLRQPGNGRFVAGNRRYGDDAERDGCAQGEDPELLDHSARRNQRGRGANRRDDPVQSGRQPGVRAGNNISAAQDDLRVSHRKAS